MAGDSVYYDPEIIELLPTALEEAWDSLSPERQQVSQKVDLAERLLAAAAAGERDPAQLRIRALMQPTIGGTPPLTGAALILRSALSREKV